MPWKPDTFSILLENESVGREEGKTWIVQKMRNERVSICRGVVSVVIDEYSRFVGERERGREREREGERG